MDGSKAYLMEGSMDGLLELMMAFPMAKPREALMDDQTVT